MFMLKSTHRDIVDTIRGSAQIVIQSQQAEIMLLQRELGERQVPAVRGSRGRFVRRIDGDHMPVEERRDYNAAEQAMIEVGDMPGAKSAWHARTGR